MKTVLTPYVLGSLIEQGYIYMLARTESIIKDGLVRIKLTPVKYKPRLEELPLEYDTYFKITSEPMQMACGVDETEIIVINEEITEDFKRLSFKKQNYIRPYSEC